MAETEKRSSRRDRSAVRHGKLKRSNGALNVLRGLFTLSLVLVLSGVSVAAYAVWDITSKVKPTVELASDTEFISGASIGALEGPITIFLAGTDTREGQLLDDGETGELNDVNLLLHVSADHQNVTVMSFPRDLMIPIPSCTGPEGQPNYFSARSEAMINSTLSIGGLACTVETVESLTGLEIPYAGLISFDGVIDMSNAVGGVEVCLTAPINDAYTGLSLAAGNVTLAGVDALQFLRSRYGVGDGGDKSRVSNQQIYMSSLVRKIKSSATLTNPLKVYGLAKATVENVTLSSSLNSIPVLQAIAAALKDVDLERINFVQYPTFAHPYQPGRLTPDKNSAKIMLDLVKSGQAVSVAATGTAVIAVDAEGNPIPDGPATPAPTEAVEPPADGSTPAPTPTTPPVVALPDNVTGQSAATLTCSQGRTQY
jgi:LCP family protein required for cell wall assembly